MPLSDFPSVPVLIGMSWLLIVGVMAAGTLAGPVLVLRGGW